MRSEVKLTKDIVLAQVLSRGGFNNRTTYIIDRVCHIYGIQRRTNSEVKSIAGKVSRVLNTLASDGVLSKSPDVLGYYGYEWTITDLGRSALTQTDGEGKPK
jgi:hypothetical protein